MWSRRNEYSELRHECERYEVAREQQHGGGQQCHGRSQGHMVGQMDGQVDATCDDQRQRCHADLSDRRQAALVHPTVSLVMITSVATCINPRMPAQ
jgi:hypothetical protein